MDWQVIILTLGASLITGLVSLVGNILMTRSNIKKAILENQEQNKKEYMYKRLKAYEQILAKINYLEQNIEDKDALETSNIKQVWFNWYPYCSDELNSILHNFCSGFIEKDNRGKGLSLSRIREQIKTDLDEYYGIKKKSRR